MDTNDKENKANEPQPSYGNSSDDKTVHIFSSMTEMEEDNYRWLATLTPEQHLQNAIVLIKRIYAEDLKKNPKLGIDLIID